MIFLLIILGVLLAAGLAYVGYVLLLLFCLGGWK